ncbi:methyltransferase domain-containing protein [Accumulibacter sp.]|uniref:class I SAM-dependent methyltransferase n=1 Tax=Accumulibacter sp. TaxID=2053492 RepID=UPI00262024C2|nr:methyltransferase domain-containing protein [Accumulibacter sp.]
MRRGEESFYVDPLTLEPLTLAEEEIREGNEVVSGVLASPSGHRFAIRQGVPDLVYPFELPAIDRQALQQYEERADAYDRYLPLTFSTYGEDEQTVRNAMVDKLELRPGAIVLETGAGTGRDSEIIARRLGAEGRLYIQDLAPSFLAKNIERLRGVATRVEPALANGYYLPFAENSFDACFHFGGINAFGDIRRAFAEMARVTKPGGKVVVGDESMPPWLRDTEFGRILMNSNPEFVYPLPLEKLPVEARKTRLEWIIGGVFYVIDFVVGVGEPPADLDFPIPGMRGGTHRTRYYGQLEGVTPEAKRLAAAARAATGKSMHQWLDDVVREAARRDLGHGD